MKKAKAFFLSVLLLLSFVFVSCKNEVEAAGTTVIWTTGGYEKVLRDVDYTASSLNKTLSFEGVKNERESAQIIITSDWIDAEYSLTINDLKDEAGNVLSKDCFEVYHQKYIAIENIKDVNVNTPLGMYPDALLPYEKAVEYGENKLAGKNQGIWFVLKTPPTQTAGTYTGVFDLEFNGEKYSVNVHAQIYDYALSSENNVKSSFMISATEIAWGELNSTEALYETYYEFLLDHRINPQHLPGNNLSGVVLRGESLEKFLYYAEKYSKDERCSSYNIPFNVTQADVEVGGKIQTMKSVDFEQLRETLVAMAERSAQNKVDLFEKAGTYFLFFDEYDMNGTVDVANYNLNKTHELYLEVAAELETTLACEDEAFKAELIASLENVKNKVVGSITEELNAKGSVIVPLISKYNGEKDREAYEAYANSSFPNDPEKWAYTCCDPRNPYPTYHIEDNLLSSRLMSWMMFDYGIKGNLYWDTALYAWRESAFGDLQLQDYYDTALRYPAANGDGFLLYPGRPYGIDGPVSSIRLESICDGNEEYELLNALREFYEARNISQSTFDALLNYLTKDLYLGTTVRVRENVNGYFSDTRKSLLQCIEAAYVSNFAIESIQPKESGTAVVFSVDAGASVYADGNLLSPTEEKEGLKVYSVEVDKIFNVNLVNQSGKSNTVSLNVSGGVVRVSSFDLADKLTLRSEGEKSVKRLEEQEYTTVRFADGEGNKSLELNLSSYEIDDDKAYVTLRIYNDGSEVAFKILSKGAENSNYLTVYEENLQTGWNEISLPTTLFNCNAYGKVDKLRLNLIYQQAELTNVLSFGDMEIGG